jgi:hypothetical protein
VPDTFADDVLARRLATQRLSTTGVEHVGAAVRLLTCVQSQDAPLARFSLVLRTRGATEATVVEAIDRGEIVRTHILRPTWHFVAAEDLRWILALTSAKVEAGMAARLRQLGLDAATVDRGFKTLSSELAGGQFRSRRSLRPLLARAGCPSTDQAGHLLLLAELRGLICSGPLERGAHTYALVDDRIPPAPARPRDKAVRDLVHRFFVGHGPASVEDLCRWTVLARAEVRAALADLGDRLATTSVDGVTLWADPHEPAAPLPGRRAWLLPTFDEAYLSYPALNFPRAPGHPSRDEPHRFAEAAGGVVICDRLDAGWWKRTNVGTDRVRVVVAVAKSLDDGQLEAVRSAAVVLAAFCGRDLELAME